MRIITIFILAISIHLIYAAESSNAPVSFMEKMRPTLEKIIGINNTEKLIGAAPIKNTDDSIAMPAIPQVVENSTSIQIYNKKADKIVLSQELEQKFYIGFLKEIYEATRKQKPNEDEVGKYLNVLSQGGTREGVYRSLVLDNSYAGLENMEGTAVKSMAADFAVFFFLKYADKKVKKDSFKGWNTYTLKRITTEKALEIIDTYGEDRGSIEAWYANLSSDIAFRFQQPMQNPLRKNTSSIVHKNWAAQVPVQHIKSELIIKLHSAFNSLM